MNKRLKELREKQTKLIADAREALDSVTQDTSEADETAANERHDTIMAEHDAIQAKYEREERTYNAEQVIAQGKDDAEKQKRDAARPDAPDAAVQPGSDGGDPPTVEQVFTRAVQYGANALSDEERSIFASKIAATDLPAEVRAQSVGTNTEGGFLVPEGFLGEITKSELAWGPMLDPGVTREIITDKGNALPWPTVDDTANSGTLTAENAASPEDGSEDAVFGQKQLGAYVYRSGVIQVPIELVMDSAFDMQSLLNELLGERLARSGNAALTTGSGTSQPNGIMTAAATGITVASNAAITGDELLDLFHSVDPAYRDGPRARWMFNDSTLKAIRKLKDGDGNYLWQGADLRTSQPATLLDKPYSVNQAVASIATTARSAAFGDFGKYIVRKVRGTSLVVLRERYAHRLQTGFLAWNRLDGELSDVNAVKALVHPV